MDNGQDGSGNGTGLRKRFFTETWGMTDTSSVWPAASHLPLEGKAFGGEAKRLPPGGKLAREARLMRGVSHNFS